MKALKFIIIIQLVLFFSIAVPISGLARTLPKVRVFYHPNGEVSVTTFVAEACRKGESEKECMDRISAENPWTRGLPYDDMDPSQLPQDRKNRDKWRGAKGQGIWIDYSLVTKNEKIEELQGKLDKEFEKEKPDPSRILKLQHLIEKAKAINHNILTDEDLAMFEVENKPFLARVVSAVEGFFADIFNSIKQGFLALKSLITQKLQVGTREQPAGITVYDFETGEPYCVIVRNGQIENIPGECTFEAPSQKSESQSQNSSEENSNNQNSNNQNEATATTTEESEIINNADSSENTESSESQNIGQESENTATTTENTATTTEESEIINNAGSSENTESPESQNIGQESENTATTTEELEIINNAGSSEDTGSSNGQNIEQESGENG